MANQSLQIRTNVLHERKLILSLLILQFAKLALGLREAGAFENFFSLSCNYLRMWASNGKTLEFDIIRMKHWYVYVIIAIVAELLYSVAASIKS